MTFVDPALQAPAQQQTQAAPQTQTQAPAQQQPAPPQETIQVPAPPREETPEERQRRERPRDPETGRFTTEEIERARDIYVTFVSRAEAAHDPALIRTKAELIPATVDPLRVIDIVGLDKQADGGTHVATTAEVGAVTVVKTESKGRHNKRIRIAVS